MDRAEDIALFRYSLVREAADPKLSKAERGHLVRALAGQPHTGPGGEVVEVSAPRSTAGCAAIARVDSRPCAPAPAGRAPHAGRSIRTGGQAAKRRPPPQRGPHRRGAAGRPGLVAPPPHPGAPLQGPGLTRAALTGANVAFGRFQADYPNELWTGEPCTARSSGQEGHLVAFLDDCTRLVPGHRWSYTEDTLAAQAALRRGILARGLPSTCYLDNGSSFVSRQLLRALAVLGVRLVHSRPGRPEGRGKIERFLCATRRLVASPAEPGGTQREVLGSDGLPRPERERGQEHASKPRAVPRRMGSAVGDPRDMAKAGLLEAQSPGDGSSHPPERRLTPAPALRHARNIAVATFGARSDAQ